MKYDIASITHVGNKRTVNQDRIFAQSENGGRALLAVADGMGGLAYGERASSLVVAGLKRFWDTHPVELELKEISTLLDASIFEMHRRIYTLGEEIGAQTGSTLSLLYLQTDAYLIKQIGDSRVYCIEGGQLRQLTTDQTWYNQVVARKEMTPEQAHRHRLSHALINALGVSPELQIVTGQGTPAGGMSFLLCSDGFYAQASLELLTGDLRRQTPKAALGVLKEQVLLGDAGDNLSAILCRLTK